MYSGDREARKRRAEYVHAVVDGRSVKSGEETTIPIPRSDDGVVELLARLERTDHAEVEETDIAELEAEIDDAVYDLFDLTAEERAVVGTTSTCSDLVRDPFISKWNPTAFRLFGHFPFTFTPPVVRLSCTTTFIESVCLETIRSQTTNKKATRKPAT